MCFWPDVETVTTHSLSGGSRSSSTAADRSPRVVSWMCVPSLSAFSWLGGSSRSVRQITDQRRKPCVPRPDITHAQGMQTKPEEKSRSMLWSVKLAPKWSFTVTPSLHGSAQTQHVPPGQGRTRLGQSGRPAASQMRCAAGLTLPPPNPRRAGGTQWGSPWPPRVRWRRPCPASAPGLRTRPRRGPWPARRARP